MPEEPTMTVVALNSQPVVYPLRSKEWYEHVLRIGLQYDSLHDWQLDLTIILCDGGDAICIVATGAGKSALIHGPILAHRAAGKQAIGIVIVPTKGLADDQVCANFINYLHNSYSYHGMSTQNYRQKSIEALRAGEETRILLCTDTGAFRIDIEEVTCVIIAEMSKTFKTQTQRAGRIRKGGVTYFYFPPLINLNEQSKDAIKSRDRVEKVMVNFANCSPENCPRQTACSHWGEPFVQPPNCCVIHDPDEQARELEVKRRVDDAKRAGGRTRKLPGGPRAKANQSRRQLDKRVMVPAVMKILKEWRLLTWTTVVDRNPQDPAEKFISDELLEHLCNRMYVYVTIEIFWQLMQPWDRLQGWGRELYKVVEAVLESAGAMWGAVDELNGRRREQLDAANPRYQSGGLLGNMPDQELNSGATIKAEELPVVPSAEGGQGSVLLQDNTNPVDTAPEGNRRSSRLRKRKAES